LGGNSQTKRLKDRETTTNRKRGTVAVAGRAGKNPKTNGIRKNHGRAPWRVHKRGMTEH